MEHFEERWAAEMVAKVKREVAFKLLVALDLKEWERAEILSRILRNLLDKNGQ